MALKKVLRKWYENCWENLPDGLKNFLMNQYERLNLSHRINPTLHDAFKKCFALNTRGLFAHCDTRNVAQLSSTKNVNFQIKDNSQNIYVCSDAIPRFKKYKLNQIKNNFVLFSGDSDLTINTENLTLECLQTILDNPYLDKWYAQNLDFSHPKLIHVPIGMDYHTDYYQHSHHPYDQEITIKNILKSSQNTFRRVRLAYSNWHFALDRGDRKACYKNTPKNSCFYEPERVSRKKAWENQAKYAFCLSPEGAGYDCHRTYEAILLGAIPIVKENCLSKMYYKLPIIIVRDYSEITCGFLDKALEKISSQRFDFSSIVMKTYTNSKSLDFENLTFDEFQEIFLKS